MKFTVPDSRANEGSYSIDSLIGLLLADIITSSFEIFEMAIFSPSSLPIDDNGFWQLQNITAAHGRFI